MIASNHWSTQRRSVAKRRTACQSPNRGIEALGRSGPRQAAVPGLGAVRGTSLTPRPHGLSDYGMDALVDSVTNPRDRLREPADRSVRLRRKLASDHQEPGNKTSA